MQETHCDKTNKELTSFKMVIFFVCFVPVRLLRPNMAIFVPCDCKLQRAYYQKWIATTYKERKKLFPQKRHPQFICVGYSGISPRRCNPSCLSNRRRRKSNRTESMPLFIYYDFFAVDLGDKVVWF